MPKYPGVFHGLCVILAIVVSGLLAVVVLCGLHGAASMSCPRTHADTDDWAAKFPGTLAMLAGLLHIVTAVLAAYAGYYFRNKEDMPGGIRAATGASLGAPFGGAEEGVANPARARRRPSILPIVALMLLACAVAIPTIGDPSSFLTEQYPLMFVKYHDVAVTLSSSLEELCEEMARQYNIPKFSAPNVIGETCYTCGRILPNPDGLNADNLWFQTSGQFGAAMCRLDIGMVKNCALFPGQVIVAKGISNGKVFSASEIFTGAPPRQVELALPEKDTLHILAACGPYNLAGESQPEPLKDFIGYIIDTKPDLVIFMGPFVDETLARNEEFMNETTFENQFKSVMHFIFAQIPENLHIPIIVVPSAGQLVGMPVYPVARFTMADCVENAVAFAKSDVTRLVTFIPEPALLNINGVIVGLTSTDILSHLNQHELRWRCNGQLADTAGHMLLQQSFYPLYPSMIPSDTIAQKKFAKITYQPHLLIAPSELPAFARFVAGTICVNPEKLGQTDSGGCFTRIFIRTADDYHSDAAARIAADVIRI